MKHFVTYNQITPDSAQRFRFLQLNPIISKSIQRGETIEIKSSKNEADLVLVNQTQTWRMRQMNQTNTVLLSEINQSTVGEDPETNGQIIGKQDIPFSYELTLIPGKITYNLPIYSGPESETGELYSKDQLLQDSPCSSTEFYNHWYQLGGCEINGTAYKLSNEILKAELGTLITTIIAQGIDYLSEDANIPNDIVNSKFGETVLNKFATKINGLYRMNNDAVVKFYGIETLQTTSLDPKQFYLEWKSSMPSFYNAPLNLQLLRGFYYKQLTVLRYLNPDTLSLDLGIRVKQLLEYANQWELADIEPFLSPLTDKKIESVLLKFAKVKNVDKLKIVIKR